jgi:hypothetical protein
VGYDDPWDSSTPTPGEAVRDGDDRIRELKRRLEQFLQSFFPTFTSNDPAIDETAPPPLAAGVIKKIALNAEIKDRVAVVWSDITSMDPASLNGFQTVGASSVKSTDTVIVKQNPNNSGVFMFVQRVFDNGFELGTILSTVVTAPDSALEYTVIRTMTEDV